MKLIEVTDKVTRQEFLEVPKILYKADPLLDCPLDVEIENIFNPAKNASFQHGDATRWILKMKKAIRQGGLQLFTIKERHIRIPAHRWHRILWMHQSAGSCKSAFRRCKGLVKGQGYGSHGRSCQFRRKLCILGLLVEGFMQQGYGMQYNFPYYRICLKITDLKHILNSTPFRMISASLILSGWENRRTLLEQTGILIQAHRNENPEKYLRELVMMYNKIWSDFHESYTPLEYNDLDQIFQDAKSMLNEKYIWFAYHNNDPIGFLIVFPDFNEVFRKLKNGRLSFLNIIRLLYFKRRAITRGRLLLSGVIPEFQRTGVVGGIMSSWRTAWKRTVWRNSNCPGWEIITSRSIACTTSLGRSAKTHITYRFLFDRNAEFVRFENLSSKILRDKKNE